MILRSKVRAALSIGPGITLQFCGAILEPSKPEWSLALNITTLIGWAIYTWGCFYLITGKGYSKWLTPLAILSLPGLIILLLLPDRNRQVSQPATKRVRAAIVLTWIACVWMGSIFTLNAVISIFADPVLQQVDTTVHETQLPVATTDVGEVFLMGLRLPFSPELFSGSFFPMFENHRMNHMSVAVGDKEAIVRGMLLYRDPDQVMPENGNWLYRAFFPNSRFGDLDRMYRAQRDDFSWWNLIGDIWLTYVLVEKAVLVPPWLEHGKLYHLETQCYSGYLVKGENAKGKYITQLMFEKNGNFYDLYIFDQSDRDYNDLISSICVAGELEAERIIKSYAGRGVAREIELASLLSRKLTKEHLAEMIGLIEQHRAAGDRTTGNIDDLKAELENL